MRMPLAVVSLLGRVGVSSLAALCVDVSVFLLVLPMMPYAALAAMVGHSSGILAHYLVSSRLTLTREMAHVSGVRAETHALARFFAAGGSGMVVTTVVIYVLADRLGLHPLMAKGFAIGASFLTVFLMLRLLVLRTPSTPMSLPTPMSLHSAES